jgi:uncharacterized protein YkwD
MSAALLTVAILSLVNHERAHRGLPALAVNASLQREATSHSGRAHTPVRQCTGERGQNLAWGTYTGGSPASIMAAWMASPLHRANILDARYRYTGIGVVAAGHETTYTQDFAQRCAA